MTANRSPATTIVPVRGAPVAAATSNATEPLPLPVEPERIVIQLESDAAVHEHIALEARTPTVPDPPAGVKLADESASCITQSAADCVTLAR
jgi:hypothetical protein